MPAWAQPGAPPGASTTPAQRTREAGAASSPSPSPRCCFPRSSKWQKFFIKRNAGFQSSASYLHSKPLMKKFHYLKFKWKSFISPPPPPEKEGQERAGAVLNVPKLPKLSRVHDFLVRTLFCEHSDSCLPAKYSVCCRNIFLWGQMVFDW